MIAAPPEAEQRIARLLQAEFPGVVVWFGTCTRAWWALVPLPAGARLVEAATPRQLHEAITNAPTWPWPSPKARP